MKTLGGRICQAPYSYSLAMGQHQLFDQEAVLEEQLFFKCAASWCSTKAEARDAKISGAPDHMHPLGARQTLHAQNTVEYGDSSSIDSM